MAIFNVNESSLSKYLNEHGGAHNKYAEMKAKESKENLNRAKAHALLYGGETPNKHADPYKYLNKAEDARKESEKYKTTSTGNKGNVLGINDMNRNSKKEFQKKFGGPSGKTIDYSKRSPGKYLKAQNFIKSNNESTKLREAAEYILSVLDESEKNKLLNEKAISKQSGNFFHNINGKKYEFFINDNDIIFDEDIKKTAIQFATKYLNKEEFIKKQVYDYFKDTTEEEYNKDKIDSFEIVSAFHEEYKSKYKIEVGIFFSSKNQFYTMVDPNCKIYKKDTYIY